MIFKCHPWERCTLCAVPSLTLHSNLRHTFPTLSSGALSAQPKREAAKCHYKLCKTYSRSRHSKFKKTGKVSLTEDSRVFSLSSCSKQSSISSRSMTTESWWNSLLMSSPVLISQMFPVCKFNWWNQDMPTWEADIKRSLKGIQLLLVVWHLSNWEGMAVSFDAYRVPTFDLNGTSSVIVQQGTVPIRHYINLTKETEILHWKLKKKENHFWHLEKFGRQAQPSGFQGNKATDMKGK